MSSGYGETGHMFKCNGLQDPTSWAPTVVWAPLFYLGTVALIINRKGTEDLADPGQIDEWGEKEYCKNTITYLQDKNPLKNVDVNCNIPGPWLERQPLVVM